MIPLLLALAFGACPTGYVCLDSLSWPGPISIPRDTANEIPGTWATILPSKRHGSIDLDDRIDRIDSVLDGKRRHP